MDRAELYQYLRRQKYAVVSSLSREGAPQSALVGIAVTSELKIVFDTLRHTRKYPNLVQHSLCSAVIGGGDECTVQLEGVAFEPQGLELARYQQVYFAVWPDGPARMLWPEIAYLVLQPRWIRFSDYKADPPRIEEFIFPTGN